MLKDIENTIPIYSRVTDYKKRLTQVWDHDINVANFGNLTSGVKELIEQKN